MTLVGFTAFASTAFVVLEYLVKIVAVGVIPENRRPSSSTAWLLLILFLPVVGVPLFLLLGSPYINRRRARIQAEADELLAQGTEAVPDVPDSVDVPPELAGVVELSRCLTALPMVTGTNHGVVSDYRAGIDRMTALVEEARESVCVEIYIMARDRTTEGFFRALEDAVRRGVKVRVLLDHMGSRKYPGFRDFLRGMTAAGIDWHLMLPFQPLRGKARRIDLRNHRKLLIVDGRVAVMGSQNLIDPAYGSARNERIGRRWNDISIELTGEIVSSLEAVFIVDWYSECGEVLTIHAYREAGDDAVEAGDAAAPVAAPGVAAGDAAGAAAGQRIGAGPGAAARLGDDLGTAERLGTGPGAAERRLSDGPGAARRSGSEPETARARAAQTAAVGLLPGRHGPTPAVGGPVNAVQLIPSGPGFRTDPNLRAFTSLMYMARERLAIVSPYFVPDESLLAAVVTAAHRGVRVELYVSEVADQFMVDRAQSSYYQALLDAGVVIMRYPAPQVLHTKCFLVDDTCAVMGSSNMDMRSFGLNYEISLLAYGGDIVEQVRGVVDEYARCSTRLDTAAWERRGVVRRYTESVMRLTSSLQ
ncbi:phospholipase D-like domain-containing protein [Rothia sp. AR01]|uniref:Phospholipase D-like domain-containing protein n=1 Tax=Rothia santali TaxID=2949643 RepID=A0A9X2KIG7_9MICC|nr:phospholipase D-like domain-containing protein [Rothia santali]MCP3425995.1 phospholipase D-like domain-containing protein [Rothia santali]